MQIVVYGRGGGRNGRVVAEAKVDTQDARRVMAYRWYLGGRKSKYVMACTPTGTVLLHRLIVGAGMHQRVGHLNGDRLDNRRRNLILLP